MSNFVHGNRSDYVGIIQEGTYKVNPIADFTVSDTYINPLFTNEDNAANPAINKPEEGTTKTLNAREFLEVTDNTNGRKDYTLTLGGKLKNGAMGYVFQCWHQVPSFATNMNYKIEEADKTCKRNSYHIYVPRMCNTDRKAFVLGGCVPQVLTIDFKAQTWTATFNCATKNETEATIEIPTEDNYRDIDTIDKTNYNDTFGQFVIDGDTQNTDSLEMVVTYEVADIVGHFGSDGYRAAFENKFMGVDINFTIPYSDTVETDNKSKTYWQQADQDTVVGSFGITDVSDTNNSINIACYGGMVGQVLDTPGGDYWNFSGTITVQQEKLDPTKDYVLTHKDALGDITGNFTA